MTEAGAPPGGLFGAFVPFDERGAETFFGRADEIALLDQLLAGEARVVTFMGPSGVGKTSLLRAGLTPGARPARRRGGDAGRLPRPRAGAGARDEPARHRAARSPARTRPTTWAAWRARRRGGWS